MKLKKNTFQHIESEIYSYHDTLKEIRELRNDIMFCNEKKDENVGGGRSSVPSSPTEKIATRLATNKQLRSLEEIAEAIKKVYDEVPGDYQKLIRLKYWTKPQTKTWDGIAEEIHVNKTTAIRWRNIIVKLIAEKLGWR